VQRSQLNRLHLHSHLPKSCYLADIHLLNGFRPKKSDKQTSLSKKYSSSLFPAMISENKSRPYSSLESLHLNIKAEIHHLMLTIDPYKLQDPYHSQGKRVPGHLITSVKH